MQEKKLDPQKIERNGWQQGSCFLVEQGMEIYINSYQYAQEKLPEGLYVVLSQDCDILNSSLEKEPVVELIRVNKVEQCEPELTLGKNPRKLHLTTNDGRYGLEFSPDKRCFIRRSYLEELQADTIKITTPLRLLINWIAKRYKRHGFPDAFNRRIDSKTLKKIKRIMSEEARNTLGLFIRISSEKELMSNEIYKIFIVMLVDKSIYENEQELLKIEKGFDDIIRLFDEVEGVDVVKAQVQSTDEITLYNYQQLKQWDFDYISFVDGENGQVVGDIPV